MNLNFRSPVAEFLLCRMFSSRFYHFKMGCVLYLESKVEVLVVCQDAAS